MTVSIPAITSDCVNQNFGVYNLRSIICRCVLHKIARRVDCVCAMQLTHMPVNEVDGATAQAMAEGLAIFCWSAWATSWSCNQGSLVVAIEFQIELPATETTQARPAAAYAKTVISAASPRAASTASSMPVAAPRATNAPSVISSLPPALSHAVCN